MKSYKTIFFLLLIFPLLCLYPQNKWNPKHLPTKDDEHIDTTFLISINKNLPKYYLRYQEYYGPANKYPHFDKTHFRLELRKTKNKKEKPFQVIQSVSDAIGGPLGDHYYGERNLQSTMVDINFDDYQDLRFNQQEGGGPYVVNQTYDYYIFNPDKGIFEYYKDLSNIFNPTPIKKLKLVHSYDRDSDRRGYNSEYKWNNNKLEIIKEITYREDYNSTIHKEGKDDIISKYVRWTIYYENGKVVKSDSTIVNVKKIPKYHYLGG
jgi:hypothetical protein